MQPEKGSQCNIQKKNVKYSYFRPDYAQNSDEEDYEESNEAEEEIQNVQKLSSNKTNNKKPDGIQ